MKSVIQEASSIAKAVEQGWEKAGKPKEFSIKILEEPLKNFFGFTKRSAKVALFFDDAKQHHQATGQQRQPRQQQSRYRSDQRRSERPERQSSQESQQAQPRQQQSREPREQREQRQSREQRPQNQSQQREQRQSREQQIREPREAQPQREQQVREPREPQQREQLQPRERENREQQPREHRENREPREPREPRESREFQHEELTPQWTPAMMDYTKAWINETLDSMDLKNISFAIEPSDMHLRVIFYDNVVPDPNQEKKLFASFSTLIYEALKKEFKLPLRGHKIVLLHATAYDLQSRR